MFEFSELNNNKCEKKNNKKIKKIELSYSGFPQNQVLSAWKKSCLSGDYETCCHWAVEMVLSKWFSLLWNNVITLSAKNINSRNPKIGLFLYKMKEDYPQLFSNNPASEPSSRQAIAFLIGVLSYSPKGIVYPTPSLHITDEEINHALFKLKSTNLSSQIKSVIIAGDSHILCALIQACMNHIQNNDLNNSLRIIGWIIFLEKSKKYKEYISCGARRYSNIQEKDINDWVLLFWDIIILYVPYEAKKCKYDNIIKVWKQLFIEDYRKNNRSFKFPIIINAIILLCQINFNNIPCIHNELVIQTACSNIDKMFQDIIGKKKQKDFYK